jgi:molybdate transport system substrate-binding protein
MLKKNFILLLLLFVFVNIFTGCSKAEKQEIPLTISAAGSTTDVMEEVKGLYAEANPQVKLTMNYASSGTLQQQIEQGAPTDVFLSAAPKQMDELEKKDLIINKTRRNLLENKIVLITSPDVSDVNDFSNLTSEGVTKLSIGTPESVPAGKYAQEVLQAMGIWEELQPKLVLAKDVRQVLTYVESSDCEAGIVYHTDALISEKVKIAAFAPEKSHSPVLYPIAVIKSSKYVEEAERFLDFLNSEKAIKVFERYGFTYLTK